VTFTLYTNKGSGGFVVEAALAQAAAPFTLVTVDYGNNEQNSPAYARINPMRQVPALVLPDGTLMTESAAIVMHIANAFPGKGLAPKPGTSAHAKFLRWMLFMAVNLYETDLRYFYPERYTADRSGIDGVKAAAEARLTHCFALIEAALDPWLAGEEFSIADVYLAMLVNWWPKPAASAKLTALTARVATDPVYQPIWARYVSA